MNFASLYPYGPTTNSLAETLHSGPVFRTPSLDGLSLILTSHTPNQLESALLCLASFAQYYL